MIVDLFAGPGGWDVGAHLAGLGQPIGLEWDKGACNTRAAAGHLTVRADVAQYPPEAFAGADGLIASPPCQEFSRANLRRRGADSTRGALVNEVMRWAEAIRPRWIACEQVPDALPIWRHFAHLLRGLGYDARSTVLCAADYGVPQKRKRAILIARLDGPACWPTPTHCATGSMLTRRYVSMAEALGWGYLHEPANTVVGQSEQGGPRGLDGGSGARRKMRDAIAAGTFAYSPAGGAKNNARAIPVDEPAPTIHTGHDTAGHRWVDTRTLNGRIDAEAGPAPTITGKVPGQWVHDHPATTVMADARIRPPGHHTERQPPGTVRVSNAELGVLQGFPPDYPWTGPHIGQQIGNAIPPPLAAAILGAVAA